MKKQIYILLGAKAFSDFGFAIDFICFGIFVWTETGSAFATGCLSAAFYGGGVLGGKVIHRYGNRWDRQRAMIGADLLRMSVLLILAALPRPHQLAWLYPVVFFIGAGRAVFESTLAASLPAMSQDKLQWINSLSAGLKSGALVIGMAFAAATVKLLGYRFLFLMDALTYGLSALALLSLSLPFKEQPSNSAEQKGANDSGRISLFRTVGFSVLLLLLIRALDAFGSGTHHVGLPMLATELNKADPAKILGSIWAIWGVGMFVGSFVIRPFLCYQIDQKPNRVFLISTALMSGGFIGIFWAPRLSLLFFCAFLAGLGDGLSEISFRQTLQKTEDSIRGGLFGLSEMAVNTGLILGMLLTGWVAILSNIAHWVLLLHGIPLLAATLAIVMMSMILRPIPKPITRNI